MTIDFGIGETVRQLRRAGLRPSEPLTSKILRSPEVAFRPLLELALDTETLHNDPPECYGPLHALRLLGEIATPEMITPLLDKLPLGILHSDERMPQVWADEAPQIIGRLGAAAIAPLWAYADDEEKQAPARSAAFLALAYAVTQAPEQRDTVVAGLTERLEREQDKALRTYLVAALSELRVSDLYPRVMELYRTGQLDQELVPAKNARQAILRSVEGRLGCVRHTLWERYDEHGPFVQE